MPPEIAQRPRRWERTFPMAAAMAALQKIQVRLGGKLGEKFGGKLGEKLGGKLGEKLGEKLGGK